MKKSSSILLLAVLTMFNLSAAAQVSEGVVNSPNTLTTDQSILGKYSGSYIGVRGGVIRIALNITLASEANVRGIFTGYTSSADCYGTFPMSGSVVGSDVELIATCENGTKITIKAKRNGNKIDGVLSRPSGETAVGVSK